MFILVPCKISLCGMNGVEIKRFTRQASSIFTCTLFIVLFYLESYAQFPGVSTPTAPRPATMQPNVIIQGAQPNQPNVYQPPTYVYETSVHEQNARLMQEQQQHQRQMQINQQQVQEAIEAFEPRHANREAVCRFGARLPYFSSDPAAQHFRYALNEIRKMLTGESPLSLRDATFLVENAYFENSLSYADYVNYINEAVTLCKAKIYQLGLDLNDQMVKNMMLFHFMTDTFKLKLPEGRTLIHYPMEYDKDDPGGEEDITKQFVTKLMATNSGQCSTLPRLFVILAEAMGAETYLSHVNIHSFVKIKDNDGYWYNLELTSGVILQDQHHLLHNHMKAEALRNRIYLEPWTLKQSVGDALTELASAYIRKYGVDGFMVDCFTTILQHDPSNIRGHLLRHNYHNAYAAFLIENAGITSKEEIEDCPAVDRAYQAAMKYRNELNDMGYEPFPPELYQVWFDQISKEKFTGNQLKLKYIINNQ